MYFFVIRDSYVVAQLPEWSLLAWLILAYLLLWSRLKQVTEETVTFSKFIQTYRYECLMIFAVIASLFVSITFLQVVLYHFLTWAILPIPALKARGDGHLTQYAGLSVAITGLFLIFSIPGLTSYSVSQGLLMDQFYLWSYIHITASMALSATHPDWIVQLFKPQNVV